MIDEKKTENWLRNYALGTAVERALIGGPFYTSKDVWGNRVIFLKKQGDKYVQKEYRLRNYYAPTEFTENELRFFLDYCDLDSVIDVIANEIKKQNIKMLGGKKFLDLPLTERNKYTCNQLCDWRWLEGDDGKILRIIKNENGETVYKATCVKYAVVLDENGKEIAEVGKGEVK